MKNTTKAILQTSVYPDGTKHSQVWCPFWGARPKKENADEVKETNELIELIYYE